MTRRLIAAAVLALVLVGCRPPVTVPPPTTCHVTRPGGVCR